MSIYQEIGGTDALTAVVADFYDRVLADDELADFFAGVNMTRLKRLQVDFFTVALGGPQDAYAGAPMDEVHKGLEIGQRHFELVAEHLSAALSDAGVPAETVTAIIAAIAPLQSEIVTA